MFDWEDGYVEQLGGREGADPGQMPWERGEAREHGGQRRQRVFVLESVGARRVEQLRGFRGRV